MVICQITTVHNRFDDRIFYKQCVSLVDKGFKVYLVANAPKNAIENGVEIIPLSEKKNRIGRFFNMFSAFIKALKIQADIYHLHDPELLIIGFLLKFAGKKVVFDFHELVYFQIKDKEWLGKSRFFIASFYKLIESFAVKLFDGLILAEDGYGDYIKKSYNQYISKFQYVRNFPVLSIINNTIANENQDINTFRLIYAGGLTEIRGIYELIEALIDIDNIELILLGPWEIEAYEEKCRSSVGFNKVNYIGVVKMVEVYSYMKIADVGIATLYPKENYLTSLPVKAFEYMACGLPIIMSNFDLWQKMFSQCALFVDPKDSTDIKDKILTIKNDQLLKKKLGENSFTIVNDLYSWESESLKLEGLYNKIYAN
jgi:glycosyltransferase involved in cell wall biosynthesis